ncbi:MAG: hypothetical protein U0236_03865 [Nitrospira sp.]
MEDQFPVVIDLMDSWVALVVITGVLLISTALGERQRSKRKRADPKVVTLSEHRGIHRPNQRVAGQAKPKA